MIAVARGAAWREEEVGAGEFDSDFGRGLGAEEGDVLGEADVVNVALEIGTQRAVADDAILE